MGTVDRLMGAGAAAMAVAVLAAALAVAVPAGVGASSAGTPGLMPVVLPRDHGSHPGFGSSGGTPPARPTDAWCRRYFLLRHGVWSAAVGLAALVNVVDLRHDRIVADPRDVNLTPLGNPGVRRRSGQVVTLCSRRPRGPEGAWSITASATGDPASLLVPFPHHRARTLRLVPSKPHVLNGRRGIIPQGPAPSCLLLGAALGGDGNVVADGRKLGGFVAGGGSITSGSTS